MRIQVQFDLGQPVYVQIMDQVKSAAASGALQAGEPLPGIRPLDEQLRVNRNTVAKAYFELEREGVIETLPETDLPPSPLSRNPTPKPVPGPGQGGPRIEIQGR